MYVLGLDPGLINLGWCLLFSGGTKSLYLEGGTIKIPTNKQMPQRLLDISNKLGTIIDKLLTTYATINLACVEQTFVNNNNKTSLHLAYARAVILLTLAQRNIKILNMEPTKLKSLLGFSGNCSKQNLWLIVSNLIVCNSEAKTKFMLTNKWDNINCLSDTLKLQSHDHGDAIALAVAANFMDTAHII